MLAPMAFASGVMPMNVLNYMAKKDFAVIIKITDQMTLDWEIIVDIWVKPV